jgi:molybdate transport system substrate-binding protein
MAIGAVANGEAEIGIAQLSEIAGSAGVELAGVLPPAVQNATTYTAAIPSNAREPAAAKALVEFLRTAAAAAVFKSHGLDTP